MSFRFTQSVTRVFQYYLELEAARKRVLAQRMKGRCGGVCVTVDAYCRVRKIDIENRELYIDMANPKDEILQNDKQLCLDVKIAVWDAVAKIQKLKLAERAKIGTPPAGAQPSSMTDALSLRPYPYEALTGEHELSHGVDDPRVGGKYTQTPRYADYFVTSDKSLSDGSSPDSEKVQIGGEKIPTLDGKATDAEKGTSSGIPPDPSQQPTEKVYPDFNRKEHYTAATGVISNASSGVGSANESIDGQPGQKIPLSRKATPTLLSWIGAVHRECTHGIGGIASFSKHMIPVLLASENPSRVLEIQRQHMSMEEKTFWNRVDVIRKAQQNTIKVPLDQRRTYKDFDYQSPTNRYSPNYESMNTKTVTGHIGNRETK
ncbi:hypothetical protein XU18_1800 [Perkinsela sp. CCAP 1560/4]|nr:hypothetical protein XU18_1800 [Perkinsela sp. CCAP 1560/4]|eukprot:KNH07268.1 hypothetical protein XU18_1800 [Perkinsela sp. CCAP 1560/4]